jgi:hypothetical protein
MPCKLTEFPAPSFPSHCIANLLLFIIFFFWVQWQAVVLPHRTQPPPQQL